MYSEIEFQIEVPERNEGVRLCWVSVYKAENWKMILVILNESQM